MNNAPTKTKANVPKDAISAAFLCLSFRWAEFEFTKALQFDSKTRKSTP